MAGISTRNIPYFVTPQNILYNTQSLEFSQLTSRFSNATNSIGKFLSWAGHLWCCKEGGFWTRRVRRRNVGRAQGLLERNFLQWGLFKVDAFIPGRRFN